MMNQLPTVKNNQFAQTREAWHSYLRVIGKISAQFSLPQKHWWHVALNPSLEGVTTGVLEVGGRTFELTADFFRSSVKLRCRGFDDIEFPVSGQSNESIYQEVKSALNDKGVELDIEQAVLSESIFQMYSEEASEDLGKIVHFVSQTFSRLKGRERRETGPVVLWPHHFDIAFLWFSGALVPDTDPSDEEYSDEQINIGFSFGDQSISRPYFYITAYPWQSAFETAKLPKGANWNPDGFNGAIMSWDSLLADANPREHLTDFCQTMLLRAKELMSANRGE